MNKRMARGDSTKIDRDKVVDFILRVEGVVISTLHKKPDQRRKLGLKYDTAYPREGMVTFFFSF